ncbi:long-chain-fatty-acid--CoA ligase [Flavisphingomonas formosensis]|uniref:long-chain-fatty-acid--CoA ligase n=1 Tax=Flavisphingomonas formosensis TaxID=861534 RepID=UPI0012FCC3CB|nr:long-chain fatty acid--CoA ligase [Sphingomonas formosensis]
MSSGATLAGGQAFATGGRGSPPPVIRQHLLTDLLDDAVRRYGDRPAIDFLGRVTHYAELGELVDRAARGLQDLGVKPGTRVGLCLPNTPYYPILYFATLRVGGIVVNMNPLYVVRELIALIEDSGAEVVVTCDLAQFHDRAVATLAQTRVRHVVICPIADALSPLKRFAYKLFKRGDIAPELQDPRALHFADLITNPAAPDPVALSPEDVAVFQYTGGTTGVPKAAMLTHANLTSNAEAELIHVGGERPEQDRVVGVLPLFHVFALTTVLNFSVLVGAEMVLLPRFELHQLLATIRRTRPNYFPAVPTIYGAINEIAAKEKIDFSFIHACISGGAALPAEVRQSFETLTGSRVVEGYGLSEASPIITCNPIDGLNKAGSAGIAFPGTIIEIRDLDDPHRVLGTGERGEICARGPQVMKGYWNRAKETEAVFVDGALRTGDVGYLDEDGYLFIVDRIKDMILSGGYNVYPRVIEEALYEHPAVREAVVIGVPDAYRGQSAKAFVTLNEGASATPETLAAFLKQRLNAIERPREIEIRDSLPKTLIGKLSKKELVAEEAAKAATQQGDGNEQ